MAKSLKEILANDCILRLAYDGRTYTLLSESNRKWRVGELLCELERELGRTLWGEKCDGPTQFTYSIEQVNGRLTGVFEIKGLGSLVQFETVNCLNNGIVMKVCRNCGYHFPVYGRPDVVYCPYPANGVDGKSCKEVGAQSTRVKREKEDPTVAAYRKVYMRLKMQTRRHPEDRAAADMLAELVREGKRWRVLIERAPEGNEHEISMARYLAWIKAFGE